MLEFHDWSDAYLHTLDPFEQVYTVLFSLSHGASASSIASYTALSRSVVETQLETLCDMGLVTIDTSMAIPIYEFDTGSLTRRAVRRLAMERDPAEIEAIDETLESQVADWRAEYDVSSPRACLQSTDAGYSRKKSIPPLVLREWLFVEYYRRLLRYAHPSLDEETDSVAPL